MVEGVADLWSVYCKLCVFSYSILILGCPKITLGNTGLMCVTATWKQDSIRPPIYWSQSRSNFRQPGFFSIEILAIILTKQLRILHVSHVAAAVTVSGVF